MMLSAIVSLSDESSFNGTRVAVIGEVKDESAFTLEDWLEKVKHREKIGRCQFSKHLLCILKTCVLCYICWCNISLSQFTE